MSIRLRPHGRAVYLAAATDTIKSIHLFSDAGEVPDARGYAPHELDHALWVAGVYPTITWRFAAQPGAKLLPILGYYAVDDDGIQFDELFNEPFELAANEAIITVDVRLLMLGADR